MKIYYDAEVDALYIELRSLAAGTAENRELSEDITANYGPDGKLAGLEILDASSVLGDIAFLFPLRYKSSTPNPLRKGAFPVPPLCKGGLGGVIWGLIEKCYI